MPDLHMPYAQPFPDEMELARRHARGKCDGFPNCDYCEEPVIRCEHCGCSAEDVTDLARYHRLELPAVCCEVADCEVR
jgi:hypothetical protein